ncbi:MAG: CNNM domain-containing protein, partial [Pseudomonadota bacterium]
MDTGLWITAGAIIALLLASGFFSGSETALTAVSRGKLRARSDKGDRAAERALRLTDDSERFIGSILLGNNLVNILATALATVFFTRLFGEGGVAAATIIMTALVVIF